jgi:DNA-binding CsgD family transcriptional regulator
MAELFNIRHPTLLLRHKIQSLTQDFCQQMGLSYFQYLRCFADGSVGLLTNKTELLEYFQKQRDIPLVYSAFETQHENQASYWFLWDEALPEHPVQLAREKFGIYHGLTFVRRSRDYYDMIAVAMPKPHAHASSFYLNKLKSIDFFIHEFDKNHQQLVQTMHQNPITVPLRQRDMNCEKICLGNAKLKVKGRRGYTHITVQELACLRLLSLGRSYKEIAKQLDVSPRTVETYIYRIKLRTDFYTLQELIELLHAVSN